MAEAEVRKKLKPGARLLDHMRNAETGMDLMVIGEAILETEIEDSLQDLVRAWQVEFPKHCGLQLEQYPPDGLYHRVLADLRAQEAAQRAAYQKKLDALRSSTAALEALVTGR